MQKSGGEAEPLQDPKQELQGKPQSISERRIDFSEKSKSQRNRKIVKNYSELMQRTHNDKVPPAAAGPKRAFEM